MKRQFDGKDVIIMTCPDCNTRCRHCYISYKGNMQKSGVGYIGLQMETTIQCKPK